MRSLLIVLAGACASLGTSLVALIALRSVDQVYYEVLDDGLVQTTASEHKVNLAVAAVLEARRPGATSTEQQLADSEYYEKAWAYFAQPGTFGQAGERASRLERKQVDRDGVWTQIEVLRGAEMPTLVFVHHDDRSTRNAIAASLGTQLADLGISRR
ncbi:MAG: hypothetical protein AAF266_03740 [Planctomycetota bacterium]